MTCDQCRRPARVAVSCTSCNRIYTRCDKCGGERNAEMARDRHITIDHPKMPGPRRVA